MPNIFEYTNHRKYLRDAYEEKKKKDIYFSHRYICSHLGSDSPSLFMHILNGRLYLTEKVAAKLAEVFKLKKKELYYLNLITKFTQAKNEDDKRKALQKMSLFMHKNIKIIQPHQFAFYTKWYHTAIWALLTFFRFRTNFKSLAQMVYPTITQHQAKGSIKLLQSLGFIKKGPKGYLEPADRVISTGHTANSLAIGEFHMQSMELAKKAIDNVPRNEREISTLTVSISENSYKKVTQKLKECRAGILEIARKEKSPDRVFHINFQLFPMTKKT